MSYLSFAALTVYAGAEFGDHEGDTEALGVLVSDADAFVVPEEAGLGHTGFGIAILAHLRVGLTTVGVIIEHVSGGADVAAGRDVEANWIHNAFGAEIWDYIDDLRRLEEHYVFVERAILDRVVGLILSIYFFVKWS